MIFTGRLDLFDDVLIWPGDELRVREDGMTSTERVRDPRVYTNQKSNTRNLAYVDHVKTRKQYFVFSLHPLLV